MAALLKLRARDARDLETIAACVQDALVALGGMKYLPRERRFALMLNRFRWEAAPAGLAVSRTPTNVPIASGTAALVAAGADIVASGATTPSIGGVGRAA